MSVTADEALVPTLGPGVRLQFDKVREAWVLLGPERLFLPDPQALEILQLIDGNRSLGDIVDHLAARFDAPRQLIADDVATLLRDLAAKQAVAL